MDNTFITPHFTFAELTKTSYLEYRSSVELLAKENLEKLDQLAWHLEALRAIIGSPLVITSAVRSEELNTILGGSKTSQHLKIEAVDFVPAKKGAKSALKAIVRSGYPFGQLILEKRGLGQIVHFGVGTKREVLYSPKQVVYETWKE